MVTNKLQVSVSMSRCAMSTGLTLSCDSHGAYPVVQPCIIDIRYLSCMQAVDVKGKVCYSRFYMNIHA